MNGPLPDGVTFEPSVGDRRAVFNWLDDLDLYLQPSYTEGMPRALLEAMSRGLPCCASAVGGIPDLLPDECLSLAGDCDSLAKNIHAVILDKFNHQVLSEKSLTMALDFLSTTLSLKRNAFYSEFINSVCVNSRV